MTIYSLKETPDDDPLDNPVYDDMKAEIKALEKEVKELQQENSWLRFELEKRGIDWNLDQAADDYEKRKGVN